MTDFNPETLIINPDKLQLPYWNYVAHDPRYEESNSWGNPHKNQPYMLADSLNDMLILDGGSVTIFLEVAERTMPHEATELIQSYAKRINLWHRSDEKDTELLHRVLRAYEDNANKQYRATEAFNQHVITQLTAMQLLIKSALNAGTHHIKNVRLDGLIELVGDAIGELQKLDMDYFRSDHFPYSLFANDSSRYRLQREIWELEKQIADLKKSQPDTPDSTPMDDIPW